MKTHNIFASVKNLKLKQQIIDKALDICSRMFPNESIWFEYFVKKKYWFRVRLNLNTL